MNHVLNSSLLNAEGTRARSKMRCQAHKFAEMNFSSEWRQILANPTQMERTASLRLWDVQENCVWQQLDPKADAPEHSSGGGSGMLQERGHTSYNQLEVRGRLGRGCS